MLGGGVNVTANSSNRLYLLGSKDLVASDVEELNTYNATTYFEDGNLYIAGEKMATQSYVSSQLPKMQHYASSRGYQWINGILIQWGSFNIAGNSSGSTTFYRAFSAVYTCVCTWDKNYTGSQENYGIYNLNTTGFSISNGDGDTRTFRWIAIGYYPQS